MPRFLSVTNSDTTSSILVASIIFAIVGLSIIIYIYSFFCFYYAKLLFFFENTKRNGQKSKNETY